MKFPKHLNADIAQAIEIVNGLRQRGATDGNWFKRLDRLTKLRELRDRPLLGAAELAGATHVRLTSGWAEVVRVNHKTVTVAIGKHRAQAVKFEAVIEARSLS